jgi:hypothetical protein
MDDDLALPLASALRVFRCSGFNQATRFHHITVVLAYNHFGLARDSHLLLRMKKITRSVGVAGRPERR